MWQKVKISENKLIPPKKTERDTMLQFNTFLQA